MKTETGPIAKRISQIQFWLRRPHPAHRPQTPHSRSFAPIVYRFATVVTISVILYIKVVGNFVFFDPGPLLLYIYALDV